MIFKDLPKTPAPKITHTYYHFSRMEYNLI